MDLERHARVENIYHTVLDADDKDRPGILAAACGGDAGLQREVESLLVFVGSTSFLIDQPPSDVAAELFSEGNNNTALIGTKIGHFKIISQIGIGGMGEVFLADDTRLDRKIALKFIKPEFGTDSDKSKRFLQEAKTASSLNHPNILTVYEIGEFEGRHFIAAEFIEGQTLRKAINEGGFALDKILEISLQVATGLNAAHTAGIIHRDIKPENIMLRDDGLVKILDFGLAKILDGSIRVIPETSSGVSGSNINLSQTDSSLLMGTVAYVSPEQARFKAVDERSDIWSLTVVLYEMLHGSQPFKGKTSYQTIESILTDERPEFTKNIPDQLHPILEKGLQKNVKDRYQTVSEFLNDLADLRKELAGSLDFRQVPTIFTGSRFTSENEARISAAGRVAIHENSEILSLPYVSANTYVSRFGKSKYLATAILLLFVFSGIFAGYKYFTNVPPTTISMAVMPFANTNGDPRLDYISDGIGLSLINSLSQLDGIKVIAQNSVLDYKGHEDEFIKNVRELGVQFVLKGQVAQSGDDLRVTVELVDVLNGSRIWEEQFNRRTGELSDVEIEISQHITERLQIRLTEKQRLAQTKRPDPRAYELFLKGRFYHSKSSFETTQKAIEYYDRALEIDPGFAQAYAALASAYLYIGQNGFQEPTSVLAKARAAAEKALEIDKDLPQVNLAIAGIKRIAWDWSGAESEYKRAIELNPHFAASHFSYALHLSTMGQHERAISEMKQARDLDPLKPGINNDIAYIYYFAREYKLAFEQYEIAQELNPTFGPTFYGKGITNSAAGNFTEAIVNYREMIRLGGEFPGVDCYRGFALAKTGQTVEARGILSKLESRNEYVSPVELAILQIGLNDIDNAFATLERAFVERDSQLQYLGVDPHFDGVRSDPRFNDLIRRVGLRQ